MLTPKIKTIGSRIFEKGGGHKFRWLENFRKMLRLK